MMAISCERQQKQPLLHTMDDATAHGKLAMEHRDYESAIEHFGTALQLCIEANGGVEDHPDAAPFYARYGKALLEVAVQSSSLALVNEATVQKNYAGATVDGQDKLILLSDEDEEDGGEDGDGDGEEEYGDEDADNDEDEDSEGECNDASVTENIDQNDQGTDEKLGEESDFDLAWQMLATARLLYSKQEGSEARINESSVLEDLADLSMETETFGQAISDYESAIAALEKAPASFDISRALASLHFKLGLALEYSSKVPEAIKSLEHARSLVLSALQPAPAMAGVDKGKERVAPDERELLEIVKEIEGKLEELRSGKTLNSEGNLQEAMTQAASNTLPSSAQPVNDLSALVKKRRVVQ